MFKQGMGMATLENQKARKRHKIVYDLRTKGKTFPEIGIKLGISKQRAFYMFKIYLQYLSEQPS